MDRAEQRKSRRTFEKSANEIDRLLEVAARNIKAFYKKWKIPAKKYRPK